MDRIHWLMAAVAAVALAGAGWLYLDNRDLRAQLAHREPATALQAEAEGEADDDAGSSDGETEAKGPSLLSRLGKAARREPPKLEEPKELTREERRKQRMDFIRNLLGRDADESDEDYRARLVPMIESGLAKPRERLEEARAAAEAAANVTKDQREKLDAILADASNTAIDTVNDAIANGDLSPYRRNWSGTLQVAGGMGAILNDTESRMNEVLSPEQQQALYETGFEWGEYVGAVTPWETLNPPPPAANN
jgi:hypothetical protein